MNRLTVLFCMLCLLLSTYAYSADELLEAVLAEQKAFEEGDCEKVASYLSPGMTFYANTRKMSVERIQKFCRTIKRPFGSGMAPVSDTITPYYMSDTHGYTVRDFRWYNEEGRVVHEVVTKIWSKDENGWRMIHFQSTVMPEPALGDKAK